jgi:hypothetical protein
VGYFDDQPPIDPHVSLSEHLGAARPKHEGLAREYGAVDDIVGQVTEVGGSEALDDDLAAANMRRRPTVARTRDSRLLRQAP